MHHGEQDHEKVAPLLVLEMHQKQRERRKKLATEPGIPEFLADADAIAEAIAQGRFPPMDQLPESCKTLAAALLLRRQLMGKA